MYAMVCCFMLHVHIFIKKSADGRASRASSLKLVQRRKVVPGSRIADKLYVRSDVLDGGEVQVLAGCGGVLCRMKTMKGRLRSVVDRLL